MTIRSLLVYVGAVERGQKITVNGREVDRPGVVDRMVYRVRKISNKLYALMIKDLV